MSQELNKSLTSVAKAAGIGFAGAVAGSALGMMNQVILGRFMGPQQYGLFNLALGVVMIANTLAIFGLYGAIGRFIPFHLNRGESDRVKSTINFGSMFVIATGTMFALTVFMLAGVISNRFFREPGLETPLKLFAVGTPLLALQQVVRGVIRGFKAVKQEALLFNIGDRVIKIAFFLVSLAVVRTVYGAIAAFLIGALVTIVIAFWLISRRLFTEYRTTKAAPVARDLLSFSWPLALTGFTYLFISQTDKVLLGHFLAAEDVGIYSPVLVVAGLLAFVSTPFEYIFLPIVAECFARHDIEGLSELYKTTSKWMFLIVLPIFALIVLFAREVITFLFGIEYVGGYLALIIVSFGIAVSDAAGTPGNILVGSGNTRLNLVSEVLAAVTNVVLNVILIPRYGIVGAAVATAISYVARTMTSVSFVYVIHRIHPYRLAYLRFLSSALLVAGIVYVLKLLLPLPPSVTMFVLAVFFVVAYLVLAGLFRSFDESDRIVVEAVERRVGVNLAVVKRFI